LLPPVYFLYVLNAKGLSDLVGMVGEVTVKALVTDSMAATLFPLSIFLSNLLAAPGTYNGNDGQ